MPNPYEHLFGEEEQPQRFHEEEATEPVFSAPPPPQKDPLDTILEKISLFQQKAAAFSILMSQTRAVDHDVNTEWWAVFVNAGHRYERGSLAAEKAYHQHVTEKFIRLIDPMKSLAGLHLETLQTFIQEIDDAYYSVEKTALEVKNGKERVIDGLNLQRKILGESADNLDILDKALEACEYRMKQYVDAGGANNLSAAELALIAQNRKQLTSGREHQFDYTFFNINLIDKTAMALGFFMKETSNQYLQKLMLAFENR